MEIKLTRTFDQDDFKGGHIRFWRVVGPEGHPFLGSDISTLKLKEMWLVGWRYTVKRILKKWGIIQ